MARPTRCSATSATCSSRRSGRPTLHALRKTVRVERLEGREGEVGASYRRTLETEPPARGPLRRVASVTEERLVLVVSDPGRSIRFEGPWHKGTKSIDYELMPSGSKTEVVTRQELRSPGLRQWLLAKALFRPRLMRGVQNGILEQLRDGFETGRQ